MSTIAWVLTAAVLAALGWIVRVAVAPIFAADRRRGLTADAEATQAQRLRLEIARPGGSPERAIDVVSSAQIEPRAERDPCPGCRGRLHVLSHTVRTSDVERLRHVVCRCGACGTERVTWFRVRPSGVTADGDSSSPC
jgi:RNase P subunit RPR2